MNSKQQIQVQLFAAVLVIASTFSVSAGGVSLHCFSRLVRDAQTAINPEVRIEILKRVVVATKGFDSRYALEQQDILVLANLLNDKDHAVVHFAAISLGNLGSRAMAAIPQLEKNRARLDAEEDVMMIKPAQPFATEIYVALSKIDGRPLPRRQ